MCLKPSQRQLQKIVDDWNAQYPVGTPVVVKLDGGDELYTRTRSGAEVLSGHTPVIWLEKISGCYVLDRVTAIS